MSEVGFPVRSAGVVEPDGQAVTEAFADVDVETVTGSVDDVLDAGPEVAVAVGESALTRLARERPACPLVPVAAGDGVRSVPRGKESAGVRQLAEGDWTVESHPLVAVERAPGEEELALFDAMLVTELPAHISEFTVAVSGEQVARFRADGVVAATPAGSTGYGRAAGTPVIPPGPDVLAVAAIAPFATNLDHWVLPLGTVTITVERDEASVQTLVDDRTAGTASVVDPVTLSAGGHVDLVHLPAGDSPFGQQDE
jgi:NAD+ kinase